MRIPPLGAMRALEAALRTGSFSGAAEELGITPAAVGQRIRALEDDLGRRLFDRHPRGTRPTPEAARVAGRLTRGFATLAEVGEELSTRRAKERVTMTLPESFAENWMAPRLVAFSEQVAGVALGLDASNRRADLLGGAFDFAIRYAPPPGPELAALDLFGDAVLPLSTPDFAARHALSPATDTLVGVPLVHLEDRTPDPDWPDWPRWAARFGVRLPARAGATFSRFGSGLGAAVTRQALVLCGVVEAHKALEDGHLIAPFGIGPRWPTSYRYRLLWPAERRLSRSGRRVRDWVAASAAAFREQAGALLEPPV